MDIKYYIGLIAGIIFLTTAIAGTDKPSQEEALPEWKTLTEKQMRSKLKGYAFAKIRTSLNTKYPYDKSLEIAYTSCPESFPKVPGDFPCSLLSWEDQSVLVEDEKNYSAGGRVTAFESSRKIPNINGKTVLLTSHNLDGNGIKTDDIQLFYNPNKTISHYRVNDEAVIFRWKKENGEDTLKSILIVTLDKERWAKSGKEIDFSQ
jgi:hypothetical protein